MGRKKNIQKRWKILEQKDMKDTSTGEEGTLGVEVIRSFLVH